MPERIEHAAPAAPTATDVRLQRLQTIAAALEPSPAVLRYRTVLAALTAPDGGTR